MAPQSDDRGLYFGDHGEAEIGFLESDAARLKQKDGTRRAAPLVIARCEFERADNFLARHFAHAAALKGAFDGDDHRRFAVETAVHDDDAVVFLRHDALHFEPDAVLAVEGADKLPGAPGIQDRQRAFARREFDKAAPRQKALEINFSFHFPLSSTACCSRSETMPGVAPKSLISMDAFP